MTSKEFWEYDPELFNVYRTLFLKKKKEEVDYDNYLCWLQGLYIHDGNRILTEKEIKSIGKMMGGKNIQDSKDTYPKQPYDLFKEKKEKTQKEKNLEEYRNSINYYGSIKKRYIEKLKAKGAIKNG